MRWHACCNSLRTFLLLDEPTNHLDIRAKDVLLQALQDYTGTVVFVSHDRYFIDKLATRIFEIADGSVNVYPGNYEDYLWRKQGGQAALDASLQQQFAAAAPKNGNHKDGAQAETVPPPEAKQKRINPIKLRQMQERCQALESEIQGLEQSIAECETALQNFVSAEETMRVTEALRITEKIWSREWRSGRSCRRRWKRARRAVEYGEHRFGVESAHGEEQPAFRSNLSLLQCATED